MLPLYINFFIYINSKSQPTVFILVFKFFKSTVYLLRYRLMDVKLLTSRYPTLYENQNRVLRKKRHRRRIQKSQKEVVKDMRSVYPYERQRRKPRKQQRYFRPKWLTLRERKEWRNCLFKDVQVRRFGKVCGTVVGGSRKEWCSSSHLGTRYPDIVERDEGASCRGGLLLKKTHETRLTRLFLTYQSKPLTCQNIYKYSSVNINTTSSEDIEKVKHMVTLDDHVFLDVDNNT